MPTNKSPNKSPIEMSFTDHMLAITRAALEFNTQIIEIATQVIASDASGHNRTTVKRVQEQFQNLNRNYSRQVDETNKRIIAQFLPTLKDE